jgi:hypothetical protein
VGRRAHRAPQDRRAGRRIRHPCCTARVRSVLVPLRCLAAKLSVPGAL